MVKKIPKGISIIEALVSMVIIRVGFVAMIQLSAYSISLMDRNTERNKMNFLSEMVLEDMIGDPDNVSQYSAFSASCSYSAQGGSNLHNKKKDRWRKTLHEKDFIKFDKGSGFKDKKPPCNSADTKKTYVNTNNNKTSGRVNFFTGKGKQKKFLGVLIK